MMPFFFGPSSRPLYGVLDPAAGGSRSGVVLCQPAGSEYFFAHRSCRLLARRLAEAGVHALRFDPSGTGDSGGEVEDVTPADWIADVGLAIEELRASAAVRAVTLVGLRGGCSTVLAAGLPEPLVESVVLWDPLPLEEPVIGAPDDFPSISEALSSDGADDPRDVLIVRTSGTEPGPIDEALRVYGHDLDTVDVEEAGAWERGNGIGSLPVPARSIDTIVRWIGSRA
ncbi:MAG: hypothetical protein AAF389_05175 [Gemmatimonadota bacterium]